MLLSVIYDRGWGLTLHMDGIPPKSYTVKLMDCNRRNGTYLQQFTFREYDDAKKTFDELQRAYDLH